MGRRCGFGLKMRPTRLSQRCIHNPQRAHNQAFGEDDQFELEILFGPEGEQSSEPPVRETGGGDSVGTLADSFRRPGGHGLDDSQADPHDEK